MCNILFIKLKNNLVHLQLQLHNINKSKSMSLHLQKRFYLIIIKLTGSDFNCPMVK